MAVKKLSDLPQKTSTDNGDGFVITSVTGQDMRVPFQNLGITELESDVDDLQANQLASTIGFETKALMDTDLVHDAGTVAQVMNDSTASNNGYYRKDGASGAGSWVKRASLYAETLDPDDTSEAVSGKAVGDYRREVNFNTNIFQPQSNFINKSDVDVSDLKRAIKKIVVYNGDTSLKLSPAIVRRNDAGRWEIDIYVDNGDGSGNDWEFWARWREDSYSEPSGVDVLEVHGDFNWAEIYIDWSELNSSLYPAVTYNAAGISGSAFSKTPQPTDVFQPNASLISTVNIVLSAGFAFWMKEAIVDVKIRGISPDAKLSPYIVRRNYEGSWRVIFMVDLGDGNGADETRHIIADWQESSYSEPSGIDNLSVSGLGFEIELWIDWSKVPEGESNGSLTYNGFGINTNKFVQPEKEIKGYPMSVPDGFTMDVPFRIYKSGQNYYPDYDINSKKPSTDQTYYVNPKLSDDNGDGLSWGAARKSIRNLITDLNSAGVTSAKVELYPGQYLVTDGTANGWSGENPNFDLHLTCPFGKAQFIRGIKLSVGDLSKSAGYTNVYEYTKPSGSGPSHPIDLKSDNYDEYGVPKRIIEAATVSDVDQTPGSFLRDGNTIYIHSLDSRDLSTTDHIVVQLSTNGEVGRFDTNHTLFAENIDFWGGIPFKAESDQATSLYFYKCDFAYSLAFDGFDIDLDRGAFVILQECRAYYNYKDGFNYHNNVDSNACDAVEIDCKAWGNGFDGVSNNGSTIHDGARIVRVNSSYVRNEVRNIHDISNGSEVWMLGCNAGEATKETFDGWESANFIFGLQGSSDTVKAWLDGCVSDGGSVTDFGIFSSAGVLKHRNLVGAENIVQDGTYERY